MNIEKEFEKQQTMIEAQQERIKNLEKALALAEYQLKVQDRIIQEYEEQVKI